MKAAIALISSSEKPLAMRSITVAGRLPVRNSVIAVTICAASRPLRRGTGVATPAVAGWQPLQDDAPGGASAAEALAISASRVAAPNPNTRTVSMAFLALPRRQPGRHIQSLYLGKSHRASRRLVPPI